MGAAFRPLRKTRCSPVLGLSSHGLGTASRWFRITVQVTQGQRRLRLATDVERDPNTHQLNVLQRRFLPSMAHEMPR